MNNTIFFTVVIPLYNKEETIHTTIESVLRQTYKNFELLVIDDGSTDGSATKVKDIPDERVKLITKPNGGVSSARNLGIIKAKGDYIAFLDGDDKWESDFIETIVFLIGEYPEISVFSTGFAFIVGKEVMQAQKIENGIVENYFEKAINTPVVHSSSICIKKDVFEKVAPFNEGISHGEDLELWARIGKIYKIAICKDIKAYYMRGLANQATTFMVAPKKSIVNYVKFDSSQDVYEKKYYKKIIISRVFSYVKRKQFIYAGKIFFKYFEHISLSDYSKYFKTKIIQKKNKN